jgi:arabinofuranan 3-O-arabinosyltransferase
VNANWIYRSSDATTGPVERPDVEPRRDRETRRRPNIFTDWWLQSFGFALAALYLIYFAILYRAGSWIIGKTGLPIYTDFGFFWLAGIQAMHGNTAALYDPAQLARLQTALFQPSTFLYLDWAYPPTFLLILAPLGLLPYLSAFITWDVSTLLGCIAVVYLIVRRRAAIALALAAPFTAWNFLAAQNGFLTASLLGASLLCLESRPVMAGIFIGCLTYKPQFGILLPVALIASRQWRAIVSATVTTLALAIAATALFGIEAWAGVPRELFTQAGLSRVVAPDSNWKFLLTLFGFIPNLQVATSLAYFAQGATAAGLVVVVWRVWRSPVSYALKAATLSAAALLAAPHVMTYDTAAIVIPAAFLASDQLHRGLLPGDKMFWILLFAAPLAVLITLGDNAHGSTFSTTPVSLLSTVALFAVILRRVCSSDLHEAASPVPVPSAGPSR